MLKNYLKITLRNLKKQSGYSFINIVGLAVGMACCVMILLYVTDELSYDGYHRDADRIYRVNAISSIGETSRRYATTPPALAPALAASVPDVEAAARVFDSFELQGRVGGETVRIPEVFFMDREFFDIFSHEFVAGDRTTALANPDSIVLSRETARRLFGDSDPVGRIIELPPANQVQVTGVIEEVPANSHLRFNGVIPSSFLRDQEGRPAPVLTAPYFCEVYSYIRLKPGADPRAVEEKIMATHESNWGEMFKQRGTARQYPLARLRDIHLRSENEYEIGTPGDIATVTLFSAIAFLVLLIACFNFINLSTAKSAGRAREVGIRKVFGSSKRQLIRQFLGESVVLSLISLLLGLVMVALMLPSFNALARKEFGPGALLKLPVLAGLVAIILLTGFVAGVFPAFILSAFQPVTVLKGKFSSASRNSAMRKVLVVVQFAISVFMIVGILVMVRQLDYMKNKDLGFDREQLVVVPFFGGRRDEASSQRFDALQRRLEDHPGIVSASFSGSIPGGNLGYDAYLPEGRSDDEIVRALIYWVDHDFVRTHGMEIAAGRDFSRDFAADAGRAVIINEKMARVLGWGAESVGKTLFNVGRENRPGTIVGIVRDFHSEGLRMEIPPVVLTLEPRFFGFASVRLHSANVPETLRFLEGALREVSLQAFPDREFSFDYHFVDDDFRNKYPEEEKTRKITLIFGGLAILVSCLGLFGLASFTLEQRTKEIGVRKVLGASPGDIVGLLSSEFMKLVLLANVLAWPVAYYAMHRWLGGFAYRVGLRWEIFAASGLAAAIVALATILYHSMSAILSNPVDSLRYE
jgi:putative ABC transport system permease protein